MSSLNRPNEYIKPRLVGGIGEKKSNGGKQYYQQDRIYDSATVAMALPAQLPGGSYWYAVYENRRDGEEANTS